MKLAILKLSLVVMVFLGGCWGCGVEGRAGGDGGEVIEDLVMLTLAADLYYFENGEWPGDIETLESFCDTQEGEFCRSDWSKKYDIFFEVLPDESMRVEILKGWEQENMNFKITTTLPRPEMRKGD